MGDRANVYVRGADVYLYTHWDGYRLSVIVRNALARKLRWNDPSYLARIVFQQMLGSDAGETGYGISHEIGDNGRPVIMLDPSTQTTGVGEAFERAMPFAQYITLNDAKCREWHLGKPEDE